jgi:hypothetical protein
VPVDSSCTDTASRSDVVISMIGQAAEELDAVMGVGGVVIKFLEDAAAMHNLDGQLNKVVLNPALRDVYPELFHQDIRHIPTFLVHQIFIGAAIQ